MSFRVIPRLDVKGGNLVKGIRLEGLRVLGSPELFASAYAEAGADELLYIDAVASLYGRNSLLEFVSQAAKSAFIPITVGGGLRSEGDVYDALSAGADKVAINTAAVENPDLLDRLVKRFGSSTIVLSIQSKYEGKERWSVYTNNGRDNSGRDVIEWAKEAVRRGVGEVLLTAVDRDGTGKGFDLDIVSRLTSLLSVPVVASGGAGSIEDVLAVAKVSDAVSVASLIHYEIVRKLEAGDFNFGDGGEFRIVENKRRQTNIPPVSLADLKMALAEEGFATR